MDLEKEMKRIEKLHFAKMGVEHKLEEAFYYELSPAMEYISKEFNKLINKIDLKGYLILNHNVYYNEPNSSFGIDINEIKTPLGELLQGPGEIGSEEIEDFSFLVSLENCSKEISKFMLKNKVYSIGFYH